LTHVVEGRGISVKLEGRYVLKDVSFWVDQGEVLGVVGPNGSGKTTLIRAIAGFLPHEGTLLYEGKEGKKLSRREMATFLSVVPQEPPSSSLRVVDYVMLGRYPYLSRWEGESKEDLQMVMEALGELGIPHLANRQIDKLSGGELQRAVLARGLVQGQRLLLMDEPTAHLDLKAQQEIMELTRAISRNRAVIATFHDLTLAGQYSDRVLVIGRGHVAAQGEVEEVLTPEVIESVYGVKVLVETRPVFHVVPLFGASALNYNAMSRNTDEASIRKPFTPR